jgi:molybdopterin-guanine dinucleotide biosynthesis protein
MDTLWWAEAGAQRSALAARAGAATVRRLMWDLEAEKTKLDDRRDAALVRIFTVLRLEAAPASRLQKRADTDVVPAELRI